MLDVRNATAAYLDGATLAEVARNKPVDPREVLALGLMNGDGI